MGIFSCCERESQQPSQQAGVVRPVDGQDEPPLLVGLYVGELCVS